MADSTDRQAIHCTFVAAVEASTPLLQLQHKQVHPTCRRAGRADIRPSSGFEFRVQPVMALNLDDTGDLVKTVTRPGKGPTVAMRSTVSLHYEGAAGQTHSRDDGSYVILVV